jgi:hypothetical protein
MTENVEKRVLQLRNVFFFIIAAVLGFISIIVPPYIKPGDKLVFYDPPLFPIFATAIKNFSIFPTTILLTIAGIIVGYLKPEIWWLLGLATVILFPIASISEMVLYPATHNLWPLELLIYGIMSIPPIIGAFLGSKLRNRNRVQNNSAGA